MAERASERLAWAVGALAVQPADCLLEIGCGHGVAVSLACARLTSGQITAIDRSAKMIDQATRRNQGCIAAGRARLMRTSLADADFAGPRFDKIFAVHVAVFWREPERSLGIVHELLAPGGALYLFYQSPGWTEPGSAPAFAARLGGILSEHDFAVAEVLVEQLGSGPAVGVVAPPLTPEA